MLTLLVELILPVSVPLSLLYVRRRYSLRLYGLIALAVLLAATVTWWLEPRITYYSRGPLESAGIDSWPLPFAVISVAIICFPVFRFRFARSVQVLASFLVVRIWLIFVRWIS